MDKMMENLLREDLGSWRRSSLVMEDSVYYQSKADPTEEFVAALQRAFSDARGAVEHAKRIWNQPVRDALRRCAGLRLLTGEHAVKVPVQVSDQLPTDLFELFAKVKGQESWDVIFDLDIHLRTAKGLQKLAQLAGAHPDFGISADECNDLFMRLYRVLKTSGAVEIAQGFREFERDTLGMYIARGREVCIELYWMAIATFAKIFNLSIESLTVVILTHELAHAYSHVGRDVDGHDWATVKFAEASVDVVEGIAQFYTEMVVRMLADRFPEAKVAYDKLLKNQSGPYHAHLTWKPQHTHRGEIVRAAIMEFRRSGETTLDQFASRLDRR